MPAVLGGHRLEADRNVGGPDVRVLRAQEPGMWHRLLRGYLPSCALAGIGRALVGIRCEHAQREA
jgi:hypothetical protein